MQRGGVGGCPRRRPAVYFRGAERQMKQEWDTYVWPRIRHADFRFTLEIAPGGGRACPPLWRWGVEGMALSDEATFTPYDTDCCICGSSNERQKPLQTYGMGLDS